MANATSWTRNPATTATAWKATSAKSVTSSIPVPEVLARTSGSVATSPATSIAASACLDSLAKIAASSTRAPYAHRLANMAVVVKALPVINISAIARRGFTGRRASFSIPVPSTPARMVANARIPLKWTTCASVYRVMLVRDKSGNLANSVKRGGNLFPSLINNKDFPFDQTVGTVKKKWVNKNWLRATFYHVWCSLLYRAFSDRTVVWLTLIFNRDWLKRCTKDSEIT